jgi:hypothetical protein
MKKIINIFTLAFLLAANPAMAQPFWTDEIPVFQNGRQILHPWNGGLNATSIALPDLDQDGDPDLLLTGIDEGRIHHYTNDALGADGIFSPMSFYTGSVEFPDEWVHLAFHDHNADGYADFFAGRSNGRISYFQNDGSSMSFPEYEQEVAFFDSIDVGVIAAPTFADLDGDGVDELLVGNYYDGILHYRRQNSGAGKYVLIDTLRDETGIAISSTYGPNAPAFGDLDNDGDLDLLLGSNESTLYLFRNNGTVTSHSFVLEARDYIIAANFASSLTPALVDVENDGDLDLFMGTSDGNVIYYRNEGDPGNPDFQLVTRQIPLDHLDFGTYAVPKLIDIDGDNDLDFFVNDNDGHLFLYRNSGTKTDPAFTREAENFKTLSNATTLYHTWADVDRDKDPELFLGIWLSGKGRIIHYQNNGTPQNAVLDSLGYLKDKNGDFIDTQRFEFADLDGDNDMDLFANVWTSDRKMRAIQIFENQGTPGNMVLTPTDTIRDAGGNIIKDYDTFFEFSDLDMDGDQDLGIGNADGLMIYYRNTGTPQNAAFMKIDGIFDAVEMGPSNRCIPAFGDLDGDHDLDLIAGRMHGGFRFYRNLHEYADSNYPENIAPGKSVNASNIFSGHPPEQAIDEDQATSWTSGEFPPQWIELDLQSPSIIGKIELIVDQDPAGETVHQIMARGNDPEDRFTFVKEFRRSTADGDTLTWVPYSLLHDVQYLKIETIASPSWVGWREIRVYGESSGATGVTDERSSTLRPDFALARNYPNPFNPSTKIRYQIETPGFTELKIFNQGGQEVRTLVNENKNAGSYEVVWNGRNNMGDVVSSGVYIFRLKTDVYTRSRKMLFVK